MAERGALDEAGIIKKAATNVRGTFSARASGKHGIWCTGYLEGATENGAPHGTLQNVNCLLVSPRKQVKTAPASRKDRKRKGKWQEVGGRRGGKLTQGGEKLLSPTVTRCMVHGDTRRFGE